jgi:predicted nuclease with TOPRIM domain
MQIEAWGMIGTAIAGFTSGGVGIAKAYFHYKVRLVELQNQREHEIEDRRASLEENRKKANEEFLSRFEGTVKGLREQIQGLNSRMDELEPKVEAIQSLDRDVKLLSEKVDKANSWFERVKGQGSVKEIAKDVLRVSDGGNNE